MPHAQKDMSVQVNGKQPSSVFLQHLTSYPVVSDTIDTYTSNPYGRRTVDLSSSTYNTVSSHLSPYLSTPYAYLSPYLGRADHLGDMTLQRIDARFPSIKKATNDLYADGKSLVYSIPPVRFAADGGNYLFGTYATQVNKVGETNGPWAKWPVAAITTSILVARDTMGYVQSMMQRGQRETREKVNGAQAKLEAEMQ